MSRESAVSSKAQFRAWLKSPFIRGCFPVSCLHSIWILFRTGGALPILSATFLSSVRVLENETFRISSQVPVLFLVIDNGGRWESMRLAIHFPSKLLIKKYLDNLTWNWIGDDSVIAMRWHSIGLFEDREANCRTVQWQYPSEEDEYI